MKVLWVEDFDLKEHKGGAQQTNEMMIKAGREIGHTISILKPEAVVPSPDKFDIVILNNISKFNLKGLEPLVASGRCIRYEHDYWVAENQPKLFKRMKKTVFLSSLHRDTTFEKIGYKFDNYELIPSPIDSKIFKVKGKQEPLTVVYSGNLCKEKGIDGFVQYIKENPQLKFSVMGWGDGIEKIKDFENVDLLGSLNREEVVEQYQRCEYFYHRPEWKEPFGRSVVEAYLCGCNLLLNKNVGAVSWGWDFSNYNEIKKNVQSESKFWKIIEDEI